MATIARYSTSRGEPRWRVRYSHEGASTSRSGFETESDARAFAESLVGDAVLAPRRRREFGAIRPSGRRWKATYRGPDGRTHAAPSTFGSRVDAEVWLGDRRREIDRGLWNPAAAEREATPAPTLAEFADDWLATRTVRGRPIKERTREHYRELLDERILPTLGDHRIDSITADDVRRWHAALAPGRDTIRAHSYSLLKTIMTSAVNRDLVAANPCRVEGAATARRKSRTVPATLAELDTIVVEMPDRLRLMVLLAAWGAMRQGELVELRRSDVDLEAATVSITRAAVRVGGVYSIGTPKSDAGVRVVDLPPHLMPLVAEHLRRHVGPRLSDLLFPNDSGEHLQPSTLYRHFYRARAAAGRPDLRFHDLRHTGATLAAVSGATLAELMDRLGHTTPAAALRYQHAAQGRGRQIAARLSALAESGDM